MAPYDAAAPPFVLTDAVASSAAWKPPPAATMAVKKGRRENGRCLGLRTDERASERSTHPGLGFGTCLIGSGGGGKDAG